MTKEPVHEADRPPMLFVSPVFPCATGGGLSMRAWQFLVAFARHRRVTLVVGSPNFPVEPTNDPVDAERLVQDLVVLRWQARCDPSLLLRRVRQASIPRPSLPKDWAIPTPRMRRRLARLRDRRFRDVHVFRLGMLPVALHLLRGDVTGISSLDLDDWESEARASIHALLSRSDPRAARRWKAEASAYERLESEWLPRIRRVVVCSEDDRRRLAERNGLQNIAVVPNGVQIPPAPLPTSPGPDRVFLFVGSLSYPPNDQAVRFFLREVLPPLHRDDARVRFQILGAGASRSLRREIAREDHASLIGPVPSVARWYAEASAVVVPVHAGGGTRIKVLEAFAHGRPVVSTSVGVAGLDVVPGRHYLHADLPEAWRDECSRLLRDPELGTRVAAEAFGLVRRYALDAMGLRVGAWFDSGRFASSQFDAPPASDRRSEAAIYGAGEGKT